MTELNDTRRPIDLVIASAGTGKTTRLVHEIQQVIDGGTAASSILATTFTVKAADELVERIRSKLTAEGKAEAAAGLLSGRVGTVNGTFGRIVSEFALNAGRSPVANVIPEERQAKMFAISAEIAIARHAAEMVPIAQRFKIDNWENDVRRLADLVRQNDIDSAELKAHARRSWNDLRRIFPKQSETTGATLNTQLQNALARTQGALETSSDSTKTTARVKETLAEAQAVLDTGQHLPWSSWAKLSKLAPAKYSLETVRPVIAIASQHAAHPDLHADLKAYIQGVYQTAAQALDIFADYKATNGLVDFIDQEHQALRLLDVPEVAEQLRDTLSRVFVDEFQDTSPIQLALFLKTSQLAQRSFWVGDPKQAIYGFRGTDPDLITRTAEEVVPKSRGEQDTLATSYRARPRLVEFTNRLFAPAFEALGFAPETVRIEHCARKDGDGQAEPIEVWGLSGKNVSLAVAGLAEQIRLLLETPETHTIAEGTQGSPRPIGGSDIAILCRTNNRCEEVAGALANAGVRVSITRSGLLHTPEAALAFAALRYLVDPRDSLAIAETAHLFDDTEGQPSWFARSVSEEGIHSLAQELPVLAALDSARTELVELTPREALETAITASGVLDRIHSWGDALRRLTNLDALRGLANQYEDEAATLRSAATAAGLVAWLSGMQVEGSQLPRSTDPTAVNVLTYHGAKGLEWPMVVLLDLDHDRPPSAFSFHIEASDDFDIWQPLQGRWVRFWPWPYWRQRKDVHIDATVLPTKEHQAAARREHAEAVRLLYVGMTRARDYLVLAPRQHRTKGLQLAWLESLTDKDENAVLNATGLETNETLMVADQITPVRYRSATARAEEPRTSGTRAAYRMPEAPDQPQYLPYRIVPSGAELPAGTEAQVASRVQLGTRIPISGSPDMALLGEAIHAFLAFDRPGQAPGDRQHRACETLKRWSVPNLDPDHLIEMSNRLFTHLDTAFPDMEVRAEVPVFAKRNGQRLSGRIDLLLTGSAQAIIIDHKSYPGAYKTWEARALGYGAQLALYAEVIREAAACPEVQTWVHMPVVGQLIEVKTDFGR